MDLNSQIKTALKARFQFKKIGATWFQEGTCPDCQKSELYCSAENPKIIKCGRVNHCGYEENVRSLFPDLFEDWSKRFKTTEKEPNAAADAYLIHERGLDISGLRGCYRQETFKDYNSGESAATIRFSLAGSTYWERIIDRPGRFDRKAHFEKGGNWRGHCWMHPDDDFSKLAQMDEIWIEEGIFDAIASRSAFNDRKIQRTAVSAMTVNVYPDIFLDKLLKAIADGPSPKQKPVLIFAFDVGKAGVEYTRKYVDRARRDGWIAKAAQVKPDGEGTKLDWNDLWLKHQSWNGDKERAPFSEERIAKYIYNGNLTIAKTARDKAKLMRDNDALRSFQFRHRNCIYWAKMTAETEHAEEQLIVTEICNCSFQILYRERDEILDETFYFIKIDFPNNRKSEKARFSAAQCAANGEFKKRLLAFAGTWGGTAEQLDNIIKNQTRNVKTVEPVNFTGYSEPHKAWILGDIAVRDGNVISINNENYFDLGKSAVKRRSLQNILDIDYNPDKPNFAWIEDIWTAWGVKGIVAFAFFTMSAFAVQIRKKHKSLGFLEITGQAGSGKSTFIEALWQSFGRAGYEGLDPNKGTVAFLARSMMGVSNLPVGLIEGNRDEGKNHSKKFDWNELLTLYNGRSPRGTGMKSSGNEVSEPPFLGSIYLMQNDPISALPAVLERIMTMRIDKSSWTDQTREAAVRIERTPIEQMSGTIVHLIKQEADYLPFFFDRYEYHNSHMAGRVDGLHNARCVKCHSQLAAAVEALPNMFPVKQEWVKETLKFVDKMAIDRQMTAGGDHPIVAEFWSKVEFLMRTETHDDEATGHVLNKSRKPEQYISINLPHFDQRCRNAHLTPMDIDSLKRHLRGSQSRKFIATKPVNPRGGGSSMSCWVFEQPKETEKATEEY